MSDQGDAPIMNLGRALFRHSRIVGVGNTEHTGAIVNRGTMKVWDAVLRANHGWLDGAISNSGRMTIKRSKVNGNSAELGSAISNHGTLTISDSEIAGNVSFDQGGGIQNDGSLRLINVRLHDNTPHDCVGC
jgi:hypothetical protein